MQLNIGKVMNLAAKAGFPKVEKAYPSMALGTAEATPLQVATAYTMFANLGDRVAPMPITRITSGDGRTISASVPERKKVVRPDVAYVMDDMMKDVINRGTAAQAQGWGFRNDPGKTRLPEKLELRVTVGSRDSRLSLVCVVYVGFDNGDDLGMKGSDSAMPVWADFMKEALQLHPEWNGDWTMPADLRKAEIDTRNGKLIREIEESEPPASAGGNNVAKKPSPSPPAYAGGSDPMPTPAEVFVTSVPTEFRRIELFIAGTVPNKSLLPVLDENENPNAMRSPTPLDETWQESSEPSDKQPQTQHAPRPSRTNTKGNSNDLPAHRNARNRQLPKERSQNPRRRKRTKRVLHIPSIEIDIFCQRRITKNCN